MPRVLRTLAFAVWPLAAAVDALAQSPQPLPASSQEGQYPATVETLIIRDSFEADGSRSRSQEMTVRVHNSLGVAAFGQIPVQYIDGYGEVAFDRIVVEKSDGHRTEVTDGKTEDINPYGLSASPFPADLRTRRLTVPGLTPGDRLSYRVTVRHRPLFPRVGFGGFQFASGPIFARQVYELEVPADLQISLYRKPTLPEWEELASPPGRRRRRLTLAEPRNPPEKDTKAIADLAEPDVILTTFRSWDELARWWWALSSDRFQSDDAVRAEANRLVANLKDARARAEAIYAFVGGQIRYLNVGFGSGRLQPRPASEVLTTRYADCKGKHALLAALGAAAGLEVRPVLVHSQQKQLYDQVPSPEQFDHVISVVRLGADPSQWLWIDATTDWAPPGLLPPYLRGKRGLLVDEKGGHVVEIPERPPFPTRRLVETRATLDPTGPLRARVRWTLRGDLEPPMRGGLRLIPADKRKDVAQKLAEEWTKGEVGEEVIFGDASDYAQPFWFEYAVEHKMASATFQKDWDLWLPLPDLELPEADDDVKAGPVVELDLEDEVVFQGRVELPEGMKARAPLSITLDRPFALYRSRYAVEGRTLVIDRTLQVRQRKVGAEQSAAWEAFRAAVNTDRSQKFPIEAFHGSAMVLEDADALNRAGAEALDRDDAAQAATFLKQAVAKEPDHKWAWNNLGRALRKLGKPEEAVSAFARQVEVNPFDAYAYGYRGATLLFDLRRQEEGEKDLLKQIEVAPFEVTAYRDLAYLRTTQSRFAAAAELLERAAAAKPSGGDIWLQLAWARARAGQREVAAAVQRTRTLDPNPRVAISGARALWAAGDVAGAAALARETLPTLLAGLEGDADRFGDQRAERDVLFVAEGWRLQGVAAAATGDFKIADRYLTAAWTLASTPDTAVDLARLREKDGRLQEAIGILHEAAFMRPWERNAARPELDRLVTDARERASLHETSSRKMAQRQVQVLPGSPPTAEVYLRLNLLVDERGRIVAVQAHQPAEAVKLEPLRSRVMQASLPAADVDGAAFKLVRGGALTCIPQLHCSLGLALYGDEVGIWLER